MEAQEKTLEYYLALPYTVEVKRTEDGFFAKVLELPGCMTWADTFEELGPMIDDAMVTWIEGSLEAGMEIPEPGDANEDFSGKVNLRMPKSLHRDLVRKANQEGVSLNQLMVAALARSVGAPPAPFDVAEFTETWGKMLREMFVQATQQQQSRTGARD